MVPVGDWVNVLMSDDISKGENTVYRIKGEPIIISRTRNGRVIAQLQNNDDKDDSVFRRSASRKTLHVINDCSEDKSRIQLPVREHNGCVQIFFQNDSTLDLERVRTCVPSTEDCLQHVSAHLLVSRKDDSCSAAASVGSCPSERSAHHNFIEMLPPGRSGRSNITEGARFRAVGQSDTRLRPVTAACTPKLLTAAAALHEKDLVLGENQATYHNGVVDVTATTAPVRPSLKENRGHGESPNRPKSAAAVLSPSRRANVHQESVQKKVKKGADKTYHSPTDPHAGHAPGNQHSKHEQVKQLDGVCARLSKKLEDKGKALQSLEAKILSLKQALEAASARRAKAGQLTSPRAPALMPRHISPCWVAPMNQTALWGGKFGPNDGFDRGGAGAARGKGTPAGRGDPLRPQGLQPLRSGASGGDGHLRHPQVGSSGPQEHGTSAPHAIPATFTGARVHLWRCQRRAAVGVGISAGPRWCDDGRS